MFSITYSFHNKRITLIGNELDIKKESPFSQKRSAVLNMVHTNFKEIGDKVKNDIAILKVTISFIFKDMAAWI